MLLRRGQVDISIFIGPLVRPQSRVRGADLEQLFFGQLGGLDRPLGKPVHVLGVRELGDLFDDRLLLQIGVFDEEVLVPASGDFEFLVSFRLFQRGRTFGVGDLAREGVVQTAEQGVRLQVDLDLVPGLQIEHLELPVVPHVNVSPDEIVDSRPGQFRDENSLLRFFQENKYFTEGGDQHFGEGELGLRFEKTGNREFFVLDMEGRNRGVMADLLEQAFHPIDFDFKRFPQKRVEGFLVSAPHLREIHQIKPEAMYQTLVLIGLFCRVFETDGMLEHFRGSLEHAYRLVQVDGHGNPSQVFPDQVFEESENVYFFVRVLSLCQLRAISVFLCH